MAGPDNCDWCDKASVVSVDGLQACADHLDEVFNLALAPLRALLRNYRGDKQ